MADQGLTWPDHDAPIAWQENKPHDPSKATRGASGQALADAKARACAIDECAVAVGLYVVQERLWIEEIARLNAEDPAKVKPLVENGMVEALKAEGIASFPRAAR